MLLRLLAWSLSLIMLGCDPVFLTRPVQDDPAWFVRLDAYVGGGSAGEAGYNHPADWPETALKGILSRLSIQEQGLLLDRPRPPQPVFSADETARLAPALRNALLAATPSQWVTFAVTRAVADGLAITSGGLFVEKGRLHVIIANYLQWGAGDGRAMQQVRSNPLRPLRQARITLGYDPPSHVLTTRENWIGGRGTSPAVELVLDETAVFAMPQDSSPAVAPVTATPSAPTGDDLLQEHNKQMEQELDRLRRALKEQERELADLKARLSGSHEAQQTSPAFDPPR